MAVAYDAPYGFGLRSDGLGGGWPAGHGAFPSKRRVGGHLRSFVPAPENGEENNSKDAIFRLAKECGVQVRHLRPGAETLEDVFLAALGHEIQS